MSEKKESTKRSKIRVSVPLTESIYKQLQEDAQAMGVTEAMYAQMIIGNHYKSQKVSVNTISEAMKDLFGQMLTTGQLKQEDLDKFTEQAKNDTNKIINEAFKDKDTEE